MSQHDIVIVSAKRTPIGSFNGVLATTPATELGAHAVRHALSESDIDPANIDEIFMGCVLPAALGQAPARQAALGAGLPLRAGATTVNKVCGSGMKALMLAHDLIRAGTLQCAVAGGMESMSNAPYMLKKARSGYRMGHSQVYDHMMLDGLENAYDGKAMGCFAQARADVEDIDREAMDNFALESLARARHAAESGAFDKEIAPLDIRDKKTTVTVSKDQGPELAKPEKIPHLRPVFTENGSVTAANSSSISDGAAALVVMSAAMAKDLGLTPLARIVAHASHAMAPEEFTVAPVAAIEKVLACAGWQANEVDLYEINEAFAMVTLHAMRQLALSHDRVNVNGGACALGHPIGASGARIVVTLLHALTQNGGQRGVASLCIGGGEATAIAVERI